jgi:hypothetical protein
MKTIKQWLNTMPQPFKKQAKKNAYSFLLHLHVDSLEKAISSFIWDLSPEGHDYWEGVVVMLNANKLVDDLLTEQNITVDEN